jgi:hypothetical protein
LLTELMLLEVLTALFREPSWLKPALLAGLLPLVREVFERSKRSAVKEELVDQLLAHADAYVEAVELLAVAVQQMVGRRNTDYDVCVRLAVEVPLMPCR